MIGIIKYELGGKTKKEVAGLRPMTYCYLIDDDCVGKKARDTKRCVIKQDLQFED